MDEYKNILPHAINNDLMIAYVEGKLSAEDARKVEEEIASSELIGDAVEGLLAVEQKEDIKVVIKNLNTHLSSLTKQQKKRLKKHKPLDINWIVISILVLIIVAVGGYLTIHFILKNK